MPLSTLPHGGRFSACQAVDARSHGPQRPPPCAGATGARARREASPGKLGAFEDELFRNAEMADVPVVAAVALAYVDGARTVRGTGSAGPGARCGCMPAGCGRDPAPMLQAVSRAHCAQAATG
jgi:hypothetical protein